MATRTKLLSILVGMVCIVLVGTLWLRPAPSGNFGTLTCRPSNPALAVVGGQDPVVIFWGNSLLFDHSWGQGNIAPINCGRQGLRVATAATLTDSLPQIPVDMVVLAFGSVEAANQSMIDVAEWTAQLQATITKVRTKYPIAKIVVTGVPHGQLAQPQWQYLDDTAVENMNDALRVAPDVHFVDLTKILDAAGLVKQTYDGVHLTPQSYEIWERHLTNLSE